MQKKIMKNQANMFLGWNVSWLSYRILQMLWNFILYLLQYALLNITHYMIYLYLTLIDSVPFPFIYAEEVLR